MYSGARHLFENHITTHIIYHFPNRPPKPDDDGAQLAIW